MFHADPVNISNDPADNVTIASIVYRPPLARSVCNIRPKYGQIPLCMSGINSR